MSTIEGRNDTSGTASTGIVDMKVEVITIPVSDVERAQEFYVRAGWRLDVTPPGVVQLTPPGSWCSVQFGVNRTSAARGEHEQRIGAADPDWPDWYADYMVAEQAGTELPT